jgi:hypothetical protein
MLVVPHQAFTDSAVEKIAGWTAMFVVLTDVDSPEAHYTVMHVKSNYTGDTDFMTSVKIQISPAEVVDGWLQNTKEDGNCAPYCAATHLNWAKVPYPPLYAANFTAVVKSVMSPKKPASEASGGDQVNVSTAVAAVAKVASLVDQRRGLDNLWRNLLSTKDPSPTWFLKKQQRPKGGVNLYSPHTPKHLKPGEFEIYYWAAIQQQAGKGMEEGTGIIWHQGKEEGYGEDRGYVTGGYLIVKPDAMVDNELRLVIVDKDGSPFRTVKMADAQESPVEGGQMFNATYQKIRATSAWLAGHHQDTAPGGTGKRKESLTGTMDVIPSKRARRQTGGGPSVAGLPSPPSLPPVNSAGDVAMFVQSDDTDRDVDMNDNHCFACCEHKSRQVLLLCDGCSNSSHLGCAGLKKKPAGDVMWYCKECKDKDLVRGYKADTTVGGTAGGQDRVARPAAPSERDNKTTDGDNHRLEVDSNREKADMKRGKADEKRGAADEKRQEDDIKRGDATSQLSAFLSAFNKASVVNPLLQQQQQHQQQQHQHQQQHKQQWPQWPTQQPHQRQWSALPFDQHNHALSKSDATHVELARISADATVKIVTALAPAKNHAESAVAAKEVSAIPGSDPNMWDVNETADYLRKFGFLSYANHCLDANLNGMMILAIESEDLDEMPEKNKLIKRTFFNFIMKLKEKAGSIV